jgi:sugar/nucleoside kinase (ribokinase family)
MKYDIITSGYVSVDRIIKTKIPVRYGYTSIIENRDNARIYYGGCPTNIAYLAAKLGLMALPIIRFGVIDYQENGFYEYLRDAGVCLDAIKLVPNETTSNCYLLTDENNNQITLFYPGAMDKRHAGEMKDEFFEEARIGVLTVGSCDDNVEFYNKCMKHNVPLVFGMKCDFDAFPKELFKKFLFSSKIIFTNQGEREEIERLFNLGAITELLETGNADIIVTTLGKKGSIYFQKTQDGLVSSAIKTAVFGKVVDTTGSGDAYMAGFLYGYLNGMSAEDCCKLGSVLSSFIIEAFGCTTNAPTREMLMKRYQDFVMQEGN